MDLYGLLPHNSGNRLRNQVEAEISKWITDYACDADARMFQRLSNLGIRHPSVLINLAQIKSLQKYKYPLNPSSLEYILDLAQAHPILHKLIQNRPYLLAKAGMIYEHAAAFLFGGKASQANLENCLIDFADNYTSKFLGYSTQPYGAPLDSPYQVFECTFWDGELWHPAAYIERAYHKNLQGVEYCVDFHPFQVALNKLLPEDFDATHRELIREWIEHTNVDLSIHSAIVGPHNPPTIMGQQCYYDPTNAVDLHKETVLFAKDIGASSIVFHLIDPNCLSQLAEILEAAAGSNVQVTIENYYYTEKINQTSEAFIESLASLLPLLTKQTREDNLGITFDPGHYNIEGDDPVVAALRVGKWCRENGVHLTKVHATTNYGPLPCFPPNFSSDVHDRVSNLGINNRLVIQVLKSLDHNPVVTAEQIQPLIERDILFIDGAQTAPLEDDYNSVVQQGESMLAHESRTRVASANTQEMSIVSPITEVFEGERSKDGSKELDPIMVEAYQFIAGLAGIDALQEYLVYRQVQNTENMTSETTRSVTLSLMKASVETQCRAVTNLPEMLKSAIKVEGGVSKDSIGSICERLSDELLAEIYRENLDVVFSETREYQSGQIIYSEGSTGNEMFYVKRGEVEVFVADLHVATLKRGEIVGEMSLFYSLPRSATVKASVDNTELGILSRQSFQEIGESAKSILYHLYRILPERLRNLNAKYAHALRMHQSLNLPGTPEAQDTDVEDSLHFDTAFKIMSYEELELLFTEDRIYAPDEVVFAEEARGNGAYLVKSGSVRVVRRDFDFQPQDLQLFTPMSQEELNKIFAKDRFFISRELVPREAMLFATLRRGSIIGEMALIDESDRSATILSEGATLGYLSRETFVQIMETDMDLSYRFLLTLCSTMLARIGRLNRSYLEVVSQIRGHSELMKRKRKQTSN